MRTSYSFLFVLHYAITAVALPKSDPPSAYSMELGVNGLDPASHSLSPLYVRALPGQQPPPSGRYRKNDQCKACKRCVGNTVNHRKRCSVCIPCPAKTKPDRKNKSCVPETDDGRKPKDKEERFEQQKEKRRKEFKRNKFRRSFQKKLQKMKEKFKKTQQEKKEKEEKEAREKKRAETKQKRAGFCWAILAEGGAWAAGDYQGVTEDDINGLTALWPENVPEPVEAEIPEWVYDGSGFKGNIELNSAGFGALIGALARLFQAAKPALSQTFQSLKSYKPAGKPSGKAVEGAKKSGYVGKVLRDPRFQDCIAATAGAAAAAGIAEVAQRSAEFRTFDGQTQWVWTFDFSRKKEDTAPAPKGMNGGKPIHLYFHVDEDRHRDPEHLNTLGHRRTREDYQYDFHRLQYERCMQAKTWSAHGGHDNEITAVGVKDGCCAFYDGENCEGNTFLFAMTDRQDGELTGKENDAISSVWCTFDKLCNGKP